MRPVFAILVFIIVSVSRAEYPCLCSYVVELNVYANNNTNSKVLGSIYEFDCKPTYGQTTDNVFQPIQFENQIGYIEKQGGDTVIQPCDGEIPLTDIVDARSATSQAMTTPMTTSTNTHILSSTSTTALTTQPITTPTAGPIHTIPSVVQRCPEHWIRHDESCYFFDIDNTLTQQRASDECLKLNSHLVFVNSSEEQNFVSTYLEGLYAYRNSGHGELWIGGMDNVEEGTWLWRDRLTNTAIPFQYTYWGHHQPDNGKGKHEEDCVALGREHNYHWYDYLCSIRLRYICEQSSYSTAVGASVIVG